MTDTGDLWHRWLLDEQHGGDTAYRERLLIESLYPVRTEVLDNAQPRPGDTLLDVGTGHGLIAFGALERLGPSGHVIFSDVSQERLDRCRDAVSAEALRDRCGFIWASADSLTAILDASVDIVTTRSVLIYVKDKAAALREFYQVLNAGEIIIFTAALKPLVESGNRPERLAFAYLTARKD